MGHSTNIYGIISNVVTKNKEEQWAKNLEVVLSLPEDDPKYPQLSSRMFSKDFQPGWEERHISFAANYKSLEFGHIQEWRLKFEGILRQLMWLSVDVQISTDISSSYELGWLADNEILQKWDGELWTPTTKWTFSEAKKNT